MEFGLIGEHLGHSFSKTIHGMLTDAPYELHELRPDELAAFLAERDFRGINVTIPYKRAVMPHLDGLAPSAFACDAVNCIVNRDGRLTGYNTDYDGFIALASHAGVDFQGARVVILGAGGAASAVAAAARDMGAASVLNACRRPLEGQLQIAEPETWNDCDIIVNATPVGMYPDWQGKLLDLSIFPHLRGVLDCIYNPLRTRLVLDAQERGIPAGGGLYMLVGQAVRARELFDGRSLPEGACEQVYERILRGKRNIVLTGMPSCGKTTVGRQLAARTGRHYIDIDEVISLQAGMEIPEIFAREGEAGFPHICEQLINHGDVERSDTGMVQVKGVAADACLPTHAACGHGCDRRLAHDLQECGAYSHLGADETRVFVVCHVCLSRGFGDTSPPDATYRTHQATMPIDLVA